MFSKNIQQLKERLTKQQFRVTQQSGTQDPYTNKYYKHFEKGTYHCIVCGKPLFSSDHKFDKNCGWPAFYDQLQSANIIKILHKGKTEARCQDCNSHLGHIFKDGPKDKTGIRYCVNSASLMFQK